jgi:deoxyribodipyrimidine photo-lyase type I
MADADSVRRLKTTPTIVLFRQDLRLADHPALWAGAQRGPVLPVFIPEPPG